MSNYFEAAVNLYAQLGIKRNPDGSITRLGPIPYTPATPDSPQQVLSKDIPVNQSKQTLLRIFLHRRALDSPSTNLPLIVYYHGGGFIVGSATSPTFHDFCTTMAVQIPSVIVSVSYRLAPEHRLPLAYEDCVEALHCIKTTHEEWLTKFADFSNTYLMGSSAGGNIAYHVGLRAAACGDDLGSLKIKGLILHQPFFGGTERTKSEVRLVNDRILPQYINDFMWEMGLPFGAGRDHEYCNPAAGDRCGEIRKEGWKVLVTGCDGDPLIDRQMEFVKMLEEKRVEVVGKFGGGGCHGVEFFEPSKAKPLFLTIKHFMLS